MAGNRRTNTAVDGPVKGNRSISDSERAIRLAAHGAAKSRRYRDNRSRVDTDCGRACIR